MMVALLAARLSMISSKSARVWASARTRGAHDSLHLQRTGCQRSNPITGLGIGGLAVFNLPPEHRVRMRTTNGVERLNKKIKRRTRVATLFPNSASCLRLVSAILAEQDKEWMTAKSI